MKHNTPQPAARSLILLIAGIEIEIEPTSQYRLAQVLMALQKLQCQFQTIFRLIRKHGADALKSDTDSLRSQAIQHFIAEARLQMIDVIKIMIRANDLRPLAAPLDRNEFWNEKVTTSEIGIIFNAYFDLARIGREKIQNTPPISPENS